MHLRRPAAVLDGLPGWRWNFWQGLWYRLLVDREIGRLRRSLKFEKSIAWQKTRELTENVKKNENIGLKNVIESIDFGS